MRLISIIKGIFNKEYNPKKDTRARFDDSDLDSYSNKTGISKQGDRFVEFEDYLRLYTSQPAVYVCAGRIARSAASVDYQILKNGKEVKAKDLKNLLRRPNPYQTWCDLIERTFLHLELTGNSFWEVLRDPKTKEIVAIFNLMPHKMKILPHKKQFVSGYIYVPMPGQEVLYDASEIIHLKYQDPMDDYWGAAPTMAASNSITLDFWATAWNKKFFKNGAEPGGALETDQPLSQTAYDRLRATWFQRHQGLKNAHIPAILEEGLKYRPITPKHSEMEFSVMKSKTKEEIHESYGVPIEWKDVNARKAFWHDNIIPKLRQFEKTINTFLLNPEGTEDIDKLEFKFVTRSIESMLEDDLTKSQIAQANVSHGIWKANEARERLYGMDDVPWGDTYWAPVGLAPYDSGVHPGTPGSNPDVDGSGKPNQPGARVDSPYQAGGSSPSQTPKVNQPSRLDQARQTAAKKMLHPETAFFNVKKHELIDLEAIETEEPDWKNPKEVFMWKAWVKWQKAASSDEKKFIKMMKAYFADQFERAKTKARAHSLFGRVKKADEDDIDVPDSKIDAVLLDIDSENKILIKQYENVGKEILEKHGNITLGDIGVNLPFNMDDPEVVKFADKWSGSRVTSINEYTRELMRKSYSESIKAGEDFEDAMRRAGQIFLEGEGASISDFRARRIARTEVVTLTNQGRLEAAKQTGVVKKKMWVSQRIPTTRRTDAGENHWDLHGTVESINEKFDVVSRKGIDQMDGPGDINASPENICFCLCVLEFPPENEAFADLFAEAVNRDDKE